MADDDVINSNFFQIEQLQRQVTYSILENKIPNKPPPPYTLPPEPAVADTFDFPSEITINQLVCERVEKLHRPQATGLIPVQCENITANIYERLIIDSTDEFYFQVLAEGQQKGSYGMKSFFHKFFGDPTQLAKLQEHICRRVGKICAPMIEKAQELLPVRPQRNNSKGKDLVDQILLKEVISDDQNWNCFDEEEAVIKDEIVCSIYKRLLDEAIDDILQFV